LAAPVRLVAGLLVTGAGLGALVVAEGPGRSTTYAGSSVVGAVLTLCAGLGLIVAGLVIHVTRRNVRIGDLALLAGLTWFAPVWVAWQEGPPLVPSLAMVLTGFTFAFVFHLVLAYPDGRTRSRPARVLVAIVYVEALLTAVSLALLRDPYLDPGCWANCTINFFLIHPLPAVARVVQTADRWFVAAAAAALMAICVARIATGLRPARRRLTPIAAPAIVFAAAVIARAIVLQSTTIEDPFYPSLLAIFAVEAVAILLLATGLVWVVIRNLVERRAVAQIVTNLDEAPAPGSLESALAKALGDNELRLVYWLPDTRHYVDANGRSVSEPAAITGRSVTRLMEKERTVAVISHAGAVPELERQFGPAIRLGLENERLQAEVLAQLEELRASRTRIVETADLERRRLERDLHDGAQQRLLALSYDIRLAHASAAADGDRATAESLDGAIEETLGALEDLRELARGIYPAVLTEAGLATALATLADVAPLTVEILRVEDRRFPAPIETAAYFAVAEAVDDAVRRGADNAALTVVHDHGRLVVKVEDNGSDRSSPMVALADRVGALGGTLFVEPTVCRAEIPCV